MIGLTVKNIIIKKQLNFFFKVPGVLFCTIFEDCLNGTVSMRIGWFTDVPPIVVENIKYKPVMEQTRNSGFHMNCPTGDYCRIFERDQM
jgi:hypothetical protein